MWLEGGEPWAEWYPAIRNELIHRQIGVGILDRQRRLQRIRNGHGAHHPPDTQRLLAHFSTMNGRAFPVLAIPRKTCSHGLRAVARSRIVDRASRRPRDYRFGSHVGRGGFVDPVFKALLIDGRRVSGRIVSLGPGAIKLASTDGHARELPLGPGDQADARLYSCVSCARRVLR